jgi:hypothetical protein
MRNGEIEVTNIGSGNIDIVFSKSGNYSSYTVTWAEAEFLATLLSYMANQYKREALDAQAVGAFKELDESEREIILTHNNKKEIQRFQK